MLRRCAYQPIQRKQPFWRKRKEKEADCIGLMLMAAAGYDPRITPQVWEELGKMDNTGLCKYFFGTRNPSKWTEESSVTISSSCHGKSTSYLHRKYIVGSRG
ncbi:hypothetical protein Tsubulata_016612 [Turnera subulata]|uniref:Uncharacterized protein n=1 Tax=Turnera subulata TaxID=218843 RepID=A0A9Q0FQ43_9ROSI|nr:hypothetical protein Tsubulata_016612 [Turnera subulata]